MQNIILSIYKTLRDSETIATGYRVVENIEGNPDFPDAPPELAAIKKILPEMMSAYNNAKTRDMKAVELKNKMKAELVALLTVVADYVTAKCKGNRLMLLGSGFPISGASFTQVEQFIEQMDVALGAPGEATTRIRVLRGARVYMHQYTTESPIKETVWQSEISKFPFFKFVGLKSVTKYWFRVVAVGADGKMITSPIIERVIQ